VTGPLVYLVDDDDTLRAATAQSFELAGIALRLFARAEPALKAIGSGEAGAIVSDIRMPGMDGLQFLKEAQALDDQLPVILMTGHGDVPMAVGALKDGAFDFLTKPFAVDHLVMTVRRALEHRELVVDNRRLRQAVDAADALALVGESEVMARVRFQARQLAEADVDVLIEGETGTGKELVARLLHRQSRRQTRPFVTVDCHRSGKVTIKKYANRRLYDTESSTYITLDRLARWSAKGREFEVVDAKTGEDITRQVLTQIIVDEEARGGDHAADQFPQAADRPLRQFDAEFRAAISRAAMDAFQRNQSACATRSAATSSPTSPSATWRCSRKPPPALRRARQSVMRGSTRPTVPAPRRRR
jgi:polyhydroxyalkanoate synthesis repressor PhaR